MKDSWKSFRRCGTWLYASSPWRFRRFTVCSQGPTLGAVANCRIRPGTAELNRDLRRSTTLMQQAVAKGNIPGGVVPVKLVA